MRRAAIVLLAWGALLGLLTLAQAPFGPRTIEFVMLGCASATCLAAGLLLWRLDAGHGGERPRLLAEDSFATATLIVGAALTLLGAGFGLWLILIGGAVAAAGLGGIVREQLARRRTRSTTATRNTAGTPGTTGTTTTRSTSGP